ncbi:MAG: phosphate signaling complex protein PhoU, partial [Deltaproteobacteria bacterium]|nr:phosphate signaling complex protein PhoU [Deltaproteobacteria bacterium]
MRLGIRSKLFWFPVAAIVVAISTGGLYLRHVLRQELESRIEAELLHHARLAREMIRSLRPALAIEAMDPLADRLGQATSARVTVIARDGTVLGDSRLSEPEVRRIESHATRPEVRQALQRKRGLSHRFSTTLEQQMLYLALPFESRQGRGVVRVAMPLDQVERTVGQLHLLLLVAGLLALGLVVIMSAVFSRTVGQTLQRLVTSVRRLAATPGANRVPAPRGDEIHGLIGSLNQTSEELEGLVENLAAERDRFQAVLEGLGEGVLALDADGKVTHANTAAVTLLGLKEAPFGRTLHETVRAPALHELVERTGLDSSATVELELPLDPPRRLLARVTRQRHGGIVLVFHDLTELRRLETIRKDFVANVSHELRTPVSVILANTETLLDGALDDRAQAEQFLGALRRNAERLSALISDLLALSRIDAGKYELELGPMGLAAVVERAVGAAAQAAQQKDLTLRSELDTTTPQVVADEQALQQVVYNLLDNAVKYTDPGGQITVRARSAADRVRLEVCDDGPGIEPRHRQRVFERFYRVDTGRSREMGGTGLGLSIVKNLVESMRGEVGVEGVEPHGCSFWIELAGAGGAPDDVDDSPPVTTATRTPERGRRGPARPRASTPAAAELSESAYRRELDAIRKRLLLMVGGVEEMIAHALRALVERDAALATETIRSDRRVNRAEIEIDELCLSILARSRPSPADLRFITLALKVVIDLERIGDLAVNICERAVDLAAKPLLRPYTEISQMAELVRSMLHDAVDAFVDHDADKAQSVIDR